MHCGKAVQSTPTGLSLVPPEMLTLLNVALNVNTFSTASVSHAPNDDDLKPTS